MGTSQSVPRSYPELEAALPESIASAKAAGLHFTSDRVPGIRRRRVGKGFVFIDPSGKRIRDQRRLARIRAIAIPPAWADVWISLDPVGHIQAVGRDARGRKQYRYHERWTRVRNASKFDRMKAFARALPRIRRRAHEHLKLAGLPREKILATIVALLEHTQIRVGNEAYTRHNKSHGATTLRNRHVHVSGSRLRFRFRSKGGYVQKAAINDRRLASVVRNCRRSARPELFTYVDDAGVEHSVSSNDVNRYLREISGGNFTAKDFRTWAGTSFAQRSLKRLGPAGSPSEARRNVVRVIASVAERLGNTPAVCRKSYVNAEVIEKYVKESDSAGARRARRR
jgi:DNA topoisomerase I